MVRTVSLNRKNKEFKKFKHQLIQWEKTYPHWALETFIKYGEEADCIVVHDKKGYAVFTEGKAYES